MQDNWIGGLVWLVMIVAFVILFLRGKRRGRLRLGPGTSGTVYDWLNQDQQKAVEIIVEGRAGARDPEDKDGNPFTAPSCPPASPPPPESPRTADGTRRS